MSRPSMDRSEALFARATRSIPGGVNSPVRAFRGVGADAPFFVAHGDGPRMTDVDGNAYIDYVGSWGPLVLGHRDPHVMAAVEAQLANGLGFGSPTEIEVRLAEQIIEMVPSIERVRMVNSGTEATMSALRLARAATGRDVVVKFEGCYHGHVDSLLVKAGSGALTLGVPSSPGVPADLAKHTLNLPFNDADAARRVFAEQGERIACVIIEPVAGNMNCVPPAPGFLEALREGCDACGAVLIFDEVMTGFRVAAGGAQAHYGVTPDLTALGKIIGGGLPVGAFGGRAELMERVAPSGPVYQAGTLAGNPVAMAAGLATLERVAESGFHAQLEARTAALVNGARERASAHDVPLAANHAGGMFGLFFTEAESITSFADVQACDTERFKRFFHLMLGRGVYLAPSAFEAAFVSIAHDETIIDATLEAMDGAFAELARS